MYAYLIGMLGLGAIFSALYLTRTDLRRVMVYGGIFYSVFSTACFFLLRFMSSDPAKSVTPGYWSPPTLFGLGQKTGGLAIEGILFCFFGAGIAAGLYEFVFSLSVDKKSNKRLKKGHALLVGLIAGGLVYTLTPLNSIYFLIFLQFFGALALVWQRRDLLTNSLAGGLLFLLFYGLLFIIFNLLFPTFVNSYYHLQNTSHIRLLGVPLEEYLYGLTLGMLWAPLYEYEHRLKDQKKNKRRSLAPRRFSLAAGATRR